MDIPGRRNTNNDMSNKVQIEEFEPNIKPSEFYEKYFMVSDGHGNMVHPRPLTQKEKDFLDNAHTEGRQIEIKYYKKSRRIILGAEALERKLDRHLPEFLKQENEAENRDKP